MKRNAEILQLPQAPQRSVASLRNWVNSTGSIVRRETVFLYSGDLCFTGGLKDHGIAWIESLVEHTFIYFYRSFMQARMLRHFRYQPSSQAESGRQCSTSPALSYNKQLFLFDGLTLHIITHSCMAALIVLLLLVPVIAIQALSSATMQMVCVALMSSLFTVIMSGPVNARTVEMFGPSATYR